MLMFTRMARKIAAYAATLEPNDAQ